MNRENFYDKGFKDIPILQEISSWEFGFEKAISSYKPHKSQRIFIPYHSCPSMMYLILRYSTSSTSEPQTLSSIRILRYSYKEENVLSQVMPSTMAKKVFYQIDQEAISEISISKILVMYLLKFSDNKLYKGRYLHQAEETPRIVWDGGDKDDECEGEAYREGHDE